MNWIFSSLFLVFIFIQYTLLGEFLLTYFGYEKTVGKRVIAGFLFTFFLSFLVGFPCQLLHVSWNIYYWIQLLVYIIIDCYAVISQKDKIHSFIDNIKSKPLSTTCFNFMKSNWICVLFVVLFTVFSMANQLPIYQMNYDDFYYIGKVVNLIGTPNLLNEDYFSGALVSLDSVSVIRVVNTFELTYAFFTYTFHVDATFFCRCTMVINNYILFVIVYKTLTGYLVPKKYTQFSLVPFFIFLIPHGYLQNAFLGDIIPTIQSYDLWQFQTAAFYGGSIVRMNAIPILLLFSLPLFKKIEFKKIIFLACISISFISFSTIYSQIIIVYLIVYGFILSSFKCFKYFKNKAYFLSFISALCGICIILILILSRKIEMIPIINSIDLSSTIDEFRNYDAIWYRHDLIYIIFPYFGVIGLLVADNWEKRYFYCFAFGMYFILSSGMFYNLLAISSFNYSFVICRTVASSQYLCLLIFGVTIINLYNKLLKTMVIPNLISTVFIASIVVFFLIHRVEFLNYSYLGSGISSAGWSFSEILNFNNTMTASIFEDVGNYFNSLSYGNYKLYAPGAFEFDNNTTYEIGFIMSSNRIQVAERGGFENITGDELQKLNDFSLGITTDDANQIYDILIDNQVDYIMLTNENSENELKNLGAECVLEINNVSGTFHLMEVN